MSAGSCRGSSLATLISGEEKSLSAAAQQVIRSLGALGHPFFPNPSSCATNELLRILRVLRIFHDANDGDLTQKPPPKCIPRESRKDFGAEGGYKDRYDVHMYLFHALSCIRP